MSDRITTTRFSHVPFLYLRGIFNIALGTRATSIYGMCFASLYLGQLYTKTLQLCGCQLGDTTHNGRGCSSQFPMIDGARLTNSRESHATKIVCFVFTPSSLAI